MTKNVRIKNYKKTLKNLMENIEKKVKKINKFNIKEINEFILNNDYIIGKEDYDNLLEFVFNT